MAHLGQLVVTSPHGHVRIYFLQPGRLTIGRDTTNDIVLPDPKASRKHAVLECGEGGCELVDLGSRDGLWVKGARTSQVLLEEGESVGLGDCMLRYQTSEARPEPGADEEEYLTVESDQEPTVVETLAPGETTITEHGLEQSIHDTSVPRVVIYGLGRTREVRLTEDELTIGRTPDNPIHVDDRAASRVHAVLRRQGDSYLLKDLDSKNGTWVGDRRVHEELLTNGLNFRIGASLFIYKAAFKAGDITLAGTLPDRQPRRRPVVVIPGIMGSELWDGDEMIWPAMLEAMRHPERLHYPDCKLEARAIAHHVIVVPNVIKLEAYSRLTEMLHEDLGYRVGEDLLEFPYDWRQDNRRSAEQLKHAIDDWKARVLGADTKVTILAHSMGSMVTRYYINCLGGETSVERVVLMGAPCFGSPSIVQGLLYGPRLLPLGIGNQGFHELLCTLPSCYQLVPVYPCATDADGKPIDLHQEDNWVRPEHRHLLKDAREFHREMGDLLNVPTTCIFGYGVKTVTEIRVDKRGDEGWEKVRFLFKRLGDNRVHERYSFLKGADLHPVQQYHGALWTDADVRMRLKLELVGRQA